MSTVVTSKEEILEASRKLIQEQGWSAFSIRSVAAACGVSVGSIYNYYDSKAALTAAAIESVWREIFHQSQYESTLEDIESYIIWLYKQMEYGETLYPGFFSLHSLSFMSKDKAFAKQRMQQTWQHIINGLCIILKHDAKIRTDAFTEQLTIEEFAYILFSLTLSALLRQDYDPSAVLEIVRRTLY